MTLNGLRIAVVGGDRREAEIARLAAAAGATVRAFGFPMPESGIEGVQRASSAFDAAKDANYLLLPIPGIASDGSLFSPEEPEPIRPSPLLPELARGARVILGAADDELRAAAADADVELCEYESDRELMLERAPAIVEGAIAVVIANTDVTIHSAGVAVVGHGNIGSLLARTMHALGARVTVAARNPDQRAAAEADGLAAVPLDRLTFIAPELSILCSAVPAPVVGENALRALPESALVVDLAAPPGGVDREAAQSLGRRTVWARGLGSRAPLTVGRSQWGGIRERIERFERSAQS